MLGPIVFIKLSISIIYIDHLFLLNYKRWTQKVIIRDRIAGANYTIFCKKHN